MTSLSINAPAACTLVASVTSALVSIVSNLVPSVATSRPSKVLLVVIAPVIAPPDKGNFVAMLFVTVVLKLASSPNADASSLSVSKVAGAESTKLLTCVFT